MANKDYTYAQVKAGNGTFKYENPSIYSAGVKEMQQKLINIGYSISADGLFGTGTKDAVKEFQREMYIAQDGIAGENTLVRLDATQSSKYFTTYGSRLEESEWGTDVIVSRGYTDKYILCRIIFAEERRNRNAQSAVALVIKNRANHSNGTLYRRAGVSNKWIATITKLSAYSTAETGHLSATKPRRGGGASINNYVDSFWKNAVDLAEKLVAGSTITNPTGYKLSGKTITSESMTFSTQLNQCAKSQYDRWCDSYNPQKAMCFETASDCNVFCTI